MTNLFGDWLLSFNALIRNQVLIVGIAALCLALWLCRDDAVLEGAIGSFLVGPIGSFLEGPIAQVIIISNIILALVALCELCCASPSVLGILLFSVRVIGFGSYVSSSLYCRARLIHS